LPPQQLSLDMGGGFLGKKSMHFRIGGLCFLCSSPLASAAETAGACPRVVQGDATP